MKFVVDEQNATLGRPPTQPMTAGGDGHEQPVEHPRLADLRRGDPVDHFAASEEAIDDERAVVGHALAEVGGADMEEFIGHRSTA